jgi:hypothetical protein
LARTSSDGDCADSYTTSTTSDGLTRSIRLNASTRPRALESAVTRLPRGILQAILGHATYCHVPRETLMAKTLFAVDELSVLVTATALVRPTRSVLEVDARSVRKKMKDKAFARGCESRGCPSGGDRIGR